MPSLLEKIERVPAGSLTLYPGNARKGDIAAIAASLKENQQAAPLVVQRSTGYVLGGNHTLQAIRSLGWPDVDVVFIDVDDQRAGKINMALNRTADLAEYDDALLLSQLAALDDLDGTGFTGDDIDELRRITGVLGQEASAFLDPFTSPPPPAPDPAGIPPRQPAPGTGAPPGPPPASGPPADPPAAPPSPEYVQVAWVVPAASRQVIRQAISIAQQRDGLATAAEALTAVAAYYLSETESKEAPSA